LKIFYVAPVVRSTGQILGFGADFWEVLYAKLPLQKKAQESDTYTGADQVSKYNKQVN